MGLWADCSVVAISDCQLGQIPHEENIILRDSLCAKNAIALIGQSIIWATGMDSFASGVDSS